MSRFIPVLGLLFLLVVPFPSFIVKPCFASAGMIGSDISVGYGGTGVTYDSIYTELSTGYIPEKWRKDDDGYGVIIGLSSSSCHDYEGNQNYQLNRISLGCGLIRGRVGYGHRVTQSLCFNKINKAGQERSFNSLLIEYNSYYLISSGWAIEIYQFDISKMEQGNGLSYKTYFKFGFGLMGYKLIET